MHDTLGRDRRTGKRLGAATDEQPLLGGVRIGKPDPEHMPDGDGCVPFADIISGLDMSIGPRAFMPTTWIFLT